MTRSLIVPALRAITGEGQRVAGIRQRARSRAVALYAVTAACTAAAKFAWSALVVVPSVRAKTIVAVSPACSVPARCTV